jgi:pimeloyl-ACP methyl ester carboxylesterase
MTVRPQVLFAADGVRIDAGHFAGDLERCVVLAHGFTGAWRTPPIRRIAGVLGRYGGVLAIDFRGHGRSRGLSTVGDLEVLDLDAAVVHARDLGYRRVAVVGFSMGTRPWPSGTPGCTAASTRSCRSAGRRGGSTATPCRCVRCTGRSNGRPDGWRPAW